MGIAIVMLQNSLEEGRYAKHIRYETVQNLEQQLLMYITHQLQDKVQVLCKEYKETYGHKMSHIFGLL